MDSEDEEWLAERDRIQFGAINWLGPLRRLISRLRGKRPTERLPPAFDHDGIRHPAKIT